MLKYANSKQEANAQSRLFHVIVAMVPVVSVGGAYLGRTLHTRPTLVEVRVRLSEWCVARKLSYKLTNVHRG